MPTCLSSFQAQVSVLASPLAIWATLGKPLTCLITGILPERGDVEVEMNVRGTACAWHGEIALSLSHGAWPSPWKGRGKGRGGLVTQALKPGVH